MLRLLVTSALLIGCSDKAATTSENDLASIKQRCEGATEQPEGFGWELLPVELYNECIVSEANKADGTLRDEICQLGRSGGSEGSTVEVYMIGGTCRTDYE